MIGKDWIVEGRVLSFSRIALYIGAFLLVCGALLYFIAHRFEEAIQGLAGPLLLPHQLSVKSGDEPWLFTARALPVKALGCRPPAAST